MIVINIIIRIYFSYFYDIIKNIEIEIIHAIISDIPYGIGYNDLNVLHNNTNSALGRSSKSQKKNVFLFSLCRKPLNG